MSTIIIVDVSRPSLIIVAVAVLSPVTASVVASPTVVPSPAVAVSAAAAAVVASSATIVAVVPGGRTIVVPSASITVAVSAAPVFDSVVAPASIHCMCARMLYLVKKKKQEIFNSTKKQLNLEC